MIVTLCGPYRFSNAMWEKYKELTAQGHIVLLPAFDAEMSKTKKERLHRKKIRMSNAIYVVNVNGYFGVDTDDEIRYAESLEKKIMWYEPRQKAPGYVANPSQDYLTP